jgi:hypothetical protein
VLTQNSYASQQSATNEIVETAVIEIQLSNNETFRSADSLGMVNYFVSIKVM